jgi:hypothetical protein
MTLTVLQLVHISVAQFDFTRSELIKAQHDSHPTFSQHSALYTGVPKRCIHNVNIPYYNVYTSFLGYPVQIKIGILQWQVGTTFEFQHFHNRSTVYKWQIRLWPIILKSLKNTKVNIANSYWKFVCQVTDISKMAVFWVVAPCSLVEVYQRFRGPCCLHHQGDEIALQPRRQPSSYSPPWEPQILLNRHINQKITFLTKFYSEWHICTI